MTRARMGFLLAALSLGGSVGLLAWGCASGGQIRQGSPDLQVPLLSPGSGNQSATSQPAATSQAAGRDASSASQPNNQQGAGNVSIAYAGGAILGVGGVFWLIWSTVNNVITLKQDRHEREAWKEIALKCLEIIARKKEDVNTKGNFVSAMQLYNGHLYAGGQFGNSTMAKWDGTNWVPLAVVG